MNSEEFFEIDYTLLNLLRLTPWEGIEDNHELRVTLITELSKKHDVALFHFKLLGREYAEELISQTTSNISRTNLFIFKGSLPLSPGLATPCVNYTRLTPEFSAVFNAGILEYIDSQIIDSRYISSDDLKLAIEAAAVLWLSYIEITQTAPNHIELSISRKTRSKVKFDITSKELPYDGEVLINKDTNKISIKHSHPPFMIAELDDIFIIKLRSELEAINNSEDRLKTFTESIEFIQANANSELTPRKGEYSFLADALLILFSGLAIWGISFLIPVTYAAILVIVISTILRFF
ncbi:hypothetical protein RAE19_01305 [Rhodoferax sp. TBRC 17660]|uniref:Uncharacterized protein n=1 Tax=Rhodoferax potami TaxID=3068338 RepID=A0ABU3KI01_9BURK|nr:hypothetical protein [Rhodoferax sp. TBRC 17660]MDT7517391.1 hypothetical protein [Rhodoferax sp. TBRC 17660]